MTNTTYNLEIGYVVINDGFFMIGDGDLGTECRILAHFAESLDFEQFRLACLPDFVADYGYHLRERVIRRIDARLRETTRMMNKIGGSQHVHWSNAMGRYVDDGE